MIKSYSCGPSIEERHLDLFYHKCKTSLDAYQTLFAVIHSEPKDIAYVESVLSGLNHSSLRSAGANILQKYNYQRLNFNTLYTEIFGRKGIKGFYKDNALIILELLKHVNNEEKLKSILVGTPQVMETINDEMKELFPTLLNQDVFVIGIRDLFKKIFDYEFFKSNSKWNVKMLQEMLDIRYCLYCNLFNVPRTGYAFDHCLPKETFPIFSVSLFNLIPSCTNCNSNNKRNTAFYTNSHIHPYFEDYIDGYRFDLEYGNDMNNIRRKDKNYNIIYKCTDSTIMNIVCNSFSILNILGEYNHHKNAVDEILEIIYFYGYDDINTTIEFINGRGEQITIEVLYSYLLKRNLQRERFVDQNFSRLVYDLCRNNGFLALLNNAMQI